MPNHIIAKSQVGEQTSVPLAPATSSEELIKKKKKIFSFLIFTSISCTKIFEGIFVSRAEIHSEQTIWVL